MDRSRAELEEARANVENAKVNLDRNERLAAEGVVAKQTLDDAKARYDREIARMNAIQKSMELVRIGPRREQIDAVRGQLVEARGSVAFFQNQLETPSSRLRVPGNAIP